MCAQEKEFFCKQKGGEGCEGTNQIGGGVRIGFDKAGDSERRRKTGGEGSFVKKLNDGPGKIDWLQRGRPAREENLGGLKKWSSTEKEGIMERKAKSA